MANQFKNPLFWGFVFFLGGIIIGAIGWDRHESTIPERAVGSVAIMTIGVIGIVLGLFIFFTKGNKK